MSSTAISVDEIDYRFLQVYSSGYVLVSSEVEQLGVEVRHLEDLIAPASDQDWFWTTEWQEREKEADADIVAGRIARFDTMEEFLESLG